MTEGELFDPADVRRRTRRTVFLRDVERPTLVLGSTQRRDVVDANALARHRTALVRRRSGGGAVLLRPGTAVWLDTWVPRGDALWHDDVARSRRWVGEWWAAALGVPGLETHGGGPVASRWSELCCFAGVDDGEVVDGARKVVGVAQWRAREGALTHSLTYLDVDWGLLAELLGLGTLGPRLVADLGASTATVTELVDTDAERLTTSLLGRLPDPGSWALERATR